MEIEFIKLQSCGRDHILIDPYKNPVLPREVFSDLAAQMTGRRFAVGGEDLLVILPTGSSKMGLPPQAAPAALKLLCLGSDGREIMPGPMALRCVGRYAFDSGLAKRGRLAVETLEGPRTIEVIDSRNILTYGDSPKYWNQKKELRERPAERFTRSLHLARRDYNYTPIWLQRPHAIFFCSDYNPEVQELWEGMQSSDFARKTEVELVQVISREELSARVWEEGMRESLASESGAQAAVVASVLNGFTDRQVLVHLEGGNLFVHWSEEDNRLYTTGPADYVFTGTYYYEYEEGENHAD